MRNHGLEKRELNINGSFRGRQLQMPSFFTFSRSAAEAQTGSARAREVRIEIRIAVDRSR